MINYSIINQFSTERNIYFLIPHGKFTGVSNVNKYIHALDQCCFAFIFVAIDYVCNGYVPARGLPNSVNEFVIGPLNAYI